MDEWTEQEEQQVIERAKAGDPEANYALSLWALRRGEEEPDEPRWNRLAAKCLVKSAQAGYGPAKEQMASLLRQSGQEAQSAPPSAQAPAKHAAPPEDEEPDDARPSAPVRRSASAARSDARPASAARRPAPRRQREQDGEDESFDVNDASWDDGEDEDAGSARSGRGGRLSGLLPLGRKSGSGGDKWGDDKWRKMEFICVIVCAALLIVIAVMIISGKHGGDGGSGGGGSAIPPAGDAASNGSSGVLTAGDYPDAATQAAIMAADLDIQPSPEDYVAEPTTGTVSVSSEYLRLRKGPNTTYEPIAQMPNETTISIFAKKNDWYLVLYQGDEGPVYGWCSSEYLIITAGAAAAGAAATEAPGTAATEAPGTAEG